MSDCREILSGVLARPNNAVFYELSRAVRAAFPDRYLLETSDYSFDVHSYAEAGHCALQECADLPNQWKTGWHAYDNTDYRNLEHGWLCVEWEGHSMTVVSTEIHLDSSCPSSHNILIAPTEEAARGFFAAVSRWSNEVRAEVLVFSDGRWSKSESLYRSIQGTTLDNLVLPAALKDEVRDNVQGFFEAEATYDRYSLPWKRGLLFLGPPGNGKTHMIKGLANELGVPCLYVRSFSARYMTPHQCIAQAFSRARETAPCVLILEDLDSLVDDRNRSYFLNEMDGFYSNRGMLTIATTNHPERLDPAILERPSRFDRKFTFSLPEEAERFRFLELQNKGLEADLQLDRAGLVLAARETVGFSYAYLKELILSSMMAWIREDGRLPMGQVLPTQIASLAAQMKTEMSAPPVVTVEEEEEEY